MDRVHTRTHKKTGSEHAGMGGQDAGRRRTVWPCHWRSPQSQRRGSSLAAQLAPSRCPPEQRTLLLMYTGSWSPPLITVRMGAMCSTVPAGEHHRQHRQLLQSSGARRCAIPVATAHSCSCWRWSWCCQLACHDDRPPQAPQLDAVAHDEGAGRVLRAGSTGEKKGGSCTTADPLGASGVGCSCWEPSGMPTRQGH